jgi:hypothetical protein
MSQTIYLYMLCFVLRQGISVQPRLAFNLWYSYLSYLTAEIISMYYHSQLLLIIFLKVLNRLTFLTLLYAIFLINQVSNFMILFWVSIFLVDLFVYFCQYHIHLVTIICNKPITFCKCPLTLCFFWGGHSWIIKFSHILESIYQIKYIYT